MAVCHPNHLQVVLDSATKADFDGSVDKMSNQHLATMRWCQKWCQEKTEKADGRSMQRKQVLAYCLLWYSKGHLAIWIRSLGVMQGHVLLLGAKAEVVCLTPRRLHCSCQGPLFSVLITLAAIVNAKSSLYGCHESTIRYSHTCRHKSPALESWNVKYF